MIFLVAVSNLDIGVGLCVDREYELALKVLNPLTIRDVPVERLPQLLYYRAIAAHQLGLREQASEDLDYILTGWIKDRCPRRYLGVAYAMRADIETWDTNVKSLDATARKMTSIARRLALTKGGKDTQRLQKEVLINLDEMIKEAENQKKNKSAATANCPPSGQYKRASGNSQAIPLDDSEIAQTAGKGEIDWKRVKETADQWGKLPEKERARAMVELTRGLPHKYKDAIEAYFNGLQSANYKTKR